MLPIPKIEINLKPVNFLREANGRITTIVKHSRIVFECSYKSRPPLFKASKKHWKAIS